MASGENRSGAALLAVSTGSADRCRLQPGMGEMTGTKQKTLVPGAVGRGFRCAFVTLAKAIHQEARATGGKPASRPP